MKQILQNLRTGRISLVDVPVPLVREGHILVKSRYSLISLGTEKMLKEFGSSNWLKRVRDHPEKVKSAIRMMTSEGVMSTLSAIVNKLEQPFPLGYSQAGVVVAVGPNVSGFRVGDRVASNGPHAEYVCVPENLAVKIPETVSDQEAAFTVVGAVALQGIRLLNPTLGETVVVMGLGLTGMLVSLLLKANGCRVIASEPDSFKLNLANMLGIFAVAPPDIEGTVLSLTNGQGADGVLIAASAKSNDLISDAARMSRKRGRIVLTGTTGLKINRSDFYEKELSFQVSCSYGPGRYERDYEEKGLDYPPGLVRWTLNRNFQAFVQLVASGSLTLSALISNVVPLDEAPAVYENPGSGIGYLIKYPDQATVSSRSDRIDYGRPRIFKDSGIGIIGAGNYTKMTLLPMLKGFPIGAICSASGVSATFLAKRYKARYSTTNYSRILEDPQINPVIITTRHDLHARMAIDALNAGKHVLVEKPLVLFHNELDEIISVLAGGCEGTLTIGFNRRFSPYASKAKQLLGAAPINVTATINAGSVDQKSWLHDRSASGGRLLGEACHLIDLMVYLTGSFVTELCVNYFGESPEVTSDNAVIMLKFSDGSTGTIHYFSNGSREYPKERIEIYGIGKILAIDDFRALKGFGFKAFRKLTGKADKGHSTLIREFLQRAEEGGDPLIPADQIINVSRATLSIYDSFSSHGWVSVE